MVDDVQLHSTKEMARLLAEHPGYSLDLDLDLGKSLVFRKTSDQRFLGEWGHQPYIVRRTKEYRRGGKPFSLDDASFGAMAAQRAIRFPGRAMGHLRKVLGGSVRGSGTP
jgi:hypothetical protein